MIIQGVDVKLGDTVTFKTKHVYDKTSRTGKLIGVNHFDLAKTMFDIVAYHKNLNHSEITSEVPYTNMEYVVIKDEQGKYFASAEVWMIDNTFKTVSEEFKDFRVYNVDSTEKMNEVIRILREKGYPSKLM